MKICTVCKLDKPLDSFYRLKASKDGYSYRCKACDALAFSKYKFESPDKHRAMQHRRHIRFYYGLTIGEFDAISKSQDNVCKICGKENRGWRLAVDHSHETGKIRGLLCNSCNRAIGLLGDNYETVNKAALYLKE